MYLLKTKIWRFFRFVKYGYILYLNNETFTAITEQEKISLEMDLKKNKFCFFKANIRKYYGSFVPMISSFGFINFKIISWFDSRVQVISISKLNSVHFTI